MNTPNSTLRAQALEALQGKWGLAIGTMLVYFILIMAIQSIPMAGGLLSLLISPPLILGLATFSLALARKQDANIGMLFSGFQNFLTPFLAYLITIAIMLVMMIPVIIAIAAYILSNGDILKSITEAVSRSEFDVSLLSSLFEHIGLIMLIMFVCMIPAIIVSLSLSQIYYIIADNPSISAWDAVKQSRLLMRGNKLKIVLLSLSFIGWALLCILTIGIGFLWLMPYVQISFAYFYEDIKGEEVNQEIADEPQDNYTEPAAEN